MQCRYRYAHHDPVASRNSTYYDIRIHLNKHFVYHKRLIKCGSRKLDDRYLYLYLDKDLELDETKTIYKKLDDGVIDKNELDADRLYLQDDESVFGHVFVSFLSLYAYCKIENMLKKAGLGHKLSPADLLLQYSKVYHIRLDTNSIISEVPKKVLDLDRGIGLNVFPIESRS